MGCLLHDVGKMRVPPEILNKPARLTEIEMRQMELHTVYGHEMVRGRVPPGAANIVLNHHQRYNGQGYPRRTDAASGQALPAMAGKSIPVFSRIATICDVYDAATSKRPYSPAKLPVQVLHEMRTLVPRLFRSRGRAGVLSNHPAIPDWTGRETFQRRGSGRGRFQFPRANPAQSARPDCTRR